MSARASDICTDDLLHLAKQSRRARHRSRLSPAMRPAWKHDSAICRFIFEVMSCNLIANTGAHYFTTTDGEGGS
jgi:hypothetical protein